jgi:hypothetical protein
VNWAGNSRRYLAEKDPELAPVSKPKSRSWPATVASSNGVSSSTYNLLERAVSAELLADCRNPTTGVEMKRDTLSELEVFYQSVDTLTACSHNARTHSKHQIRQIAASIKAFGFTNPVLVDTHNTIIAGHGRADAAKLLDIKQVPTIRLESLTEDQIRAYVIADNRLAERAGWDKSILAIELQHLLNVE